MRIACAQYAIRDGDPDANLERSVAAILDAARGTPTPTSSSSPSSQTPAATSPPAKAP